MQLLWTLRPQWGDEQQRACTKLANPSNSPPHAVEGHTARKWFLQNIPSAGGCDNSSSRTSALFFSLASQLDWGMMRDIGEPTCLPCTESRSSCSTSCGLSSCSPHRNIPEGQRTKCFITSWKWIKNSLFTGSWTYILAKAHVHDVLFANGTFYELDESLQHW